MKPINLFLFQPKRAYTNNMITIGYFGDGPWASLAISHIVAQPDKFKIAFIKENDHIEETFMPQWPIGKRLQEK